MHSMNVLHGFYKGSIEIICLFYEYSRIIFLVVASKSGLFSHKWLVF